MCVLQSTDLLSAGSELSPGSHGNPCESSYCCIHEALSRLQEGEGWEEGASFNHVKEGQSHFTLAAPDLVSPFGSEPSAVSPSLCQQAGDELPGNSAQTFHLKDQTSEKSSGFQVRR